MRSLQAMLDANRVVLIDGATGTELERRGVPMIDNGWCAMAALTHPEIVRQVHGAYIGAGAEVIIANTFATSRHLLAWAGIEEHFERLNVAGIQLAREARDESGRPSVIVAGSLSTSQQGGELPPIDVARLNFAEQAKLLADAGAELLILEMMRDIDQTDVVLAAALDTGLPVWVGYSCFLDDDGVPMLFNGGARLAEAFDAIDHSGVESVAVMHTEIADVDACLDVIQAEWEGPVGVYAHCGEFDPPHWKFNDMVTPEAHTAHCRRWVDRGVQIVGGCCGIGPEHISHLAAELIDPSPS